jgi:aspartate aminotransferase
MAPWRRLRGSADRATSPAGVSPLAPGQRLGYLALPPIEDDVEFARRLRQDKVLVLPGRTVDLPGYFRISLTATDEMINRALPVFAAAMTAAAPAESPAPSR